MVGVRPQAINMEPKKLVVWVDVSPFPFGGHFQVPAIGFSVVYIFLEQILTILGTS